MMSSICHSSVHRPKLDCAAVSLPDQFLDHAGGFDAGEALVEALVTEGKALVVKAQQAQDGGVEIMDVNGVFDDVVREIIGLAINGARARAAASHPHGEATRVMIAPVVVFSESALGINSAAKFAAPDDQC